MSRAGATASVWYTVSMPATCASCGALEVELLAVQAHLAGVGNHRAPDRHLISDDFPAPLSPMTASTSPAYSSRSAPLSAVTRPNCLTSPVRLEDRFAILGLGLIAHFPTFRIHVSSATATRIECADREVLVEDVDAGEAEPDPEHGHDEGADQGAPDAFPARRRGWFRR